MTSRTSPSLAARHLRWLRSGLKVATGTRTDWHFVQDGHVGRNSEKPNRTDTLHSIMPTPFIKDGFIYGVCSYGELRCLEASTGRRVWESLQATGSKKTEEDRCASGQ